MNAQKIVSTINQLPTRYTERTEPRAIATIAETAAAIAPIMKAKGLQISKGGSNPSTSRGYTRIYLERAGNSSHDYRHKEYQKGVIQVWEWQTKSKYGLSPLSAKSIIDLCNALRREVENAR